MSQEYLFWDVPRTMFPANPWKEPCIGIHSFHSSLTLKSYRSHKGDSCHKVPRQIFRLADSTWIYSKLNQFSVTYHGRKHYALQSLGQCTKYLLLGKVLLFAKLSWFRPCTRIIVVIPKWNVLYHLSQTNISTNYTKIIGAESTAAFVLNLRT